MASRSISMATRAVRRSISARLAVRRRHSGLRPSVPDAPAALRFPCSSLPPFASAGIKPARAYLNQEYMPHGQDPRRHLAPRPTRPRDFATISALTSKAARPCWISIAKRVSSLRLRGAGKFGRRNGRGARARSCPMSIARMPGVFAWQEDAEGEKPGDWLALRYDLTAPLARAFAQHRNDLPTPYRRYAMGPGLAETRNRGRGGFGSSISVMPIRSARPRSRRMPRSA